MSCSLQAGEKLSKDTGAVQLNKPSKRPGDVLHTAALWRSAVVRHQSYI